MSNKKNKNRPREKRTGIIKLICGHCNKKFTIKKQFADKIWSQKQKVLCSQKCNRLSRVENTAVRKSICVYCQAKFTPLFINQKCCSQICSRKNRKNRRHTYLKYRMLVFDRDSFRCQYCGLSVKNDENLVLEIDHIIPKSKGGSNAVDNLITSCSNCNRGKGDVILNFKGV